MADAACRSCGATVDAAATTCPHCGTADPVTVTAAGPAGPGAARDPAAPPPTPAGEPEPTAGSRLKSAGKAIGCFVIALIVLAIALLVGVFDFLF